MFLRLELFIPKRRIILVICDAWIAFTLKAADDSISFSAAVFVFGEIVVDGIHAFSRMDVEPNNVMVVVRYLLSLGCARFQKADDLLFIFLDALHSVDRNRFFNEFHFMPPLGLLPHRHPPWLPRPACL